MAETKKGVSARCLAEGGICIALSLALSYLKIPIMSGFGGFGGSIDFVMIPLILFAVRWGLGWGLAAGLAFGTLKYFLSSGGAISWISIVFDYAVAYCFVGFSGLFRKKYPLLPVAALVGCFARFIIPFISGVTVYAQYMPEEFMGITGMTPVLYSVLYNGTYMIPNTIIAVAVCAAMIPLAKRLDRR